MFGADHLRELLVVHRPETQVLIFVPGRVGAETCRESSRGLECWGRGRAGLLGETCFSFLQGPPRARANCVDGLINCSVTEGEHEGICSVTDYFRKKDFFQEPRHESRAEHFFGQKCGPQSHITDQKTRTTIPPE